MRREEGNRREESEENGKRMMKKLHNTLQERCPCLRTGQALLNTWQLKGTVHLIVVQDTERMCHYNQTC